MITLKEFCELVKEVTKMKLITLTQSGSILYIVADKISTFYPHKSPGDGACHNSCVVIEGTHHYVMETPNEILAKLLGASK